MFAMFELPKRNHKKEFLEMSKARAFTLGNFWRSQAGVAQLAILLLLLAGIGLGTYLVQTRTNFLPKACESAEGTGCEDTESAPAGNDDNNADSSTQRASEGRDEERGGTTANPGGGGNPPPTQSVPNSGSNPSTGQPSQGSAGSDGCPAGFTSAGQEASDGYSACVAINSGPASEGNNPASGQGSASDKTPANATNSTSDTTCQSISYCERGNLVRKISTLIESTGQCKDIFSVPVKDARCTVSAGQAETSIDGKVIEGDLGTDLAVRKARLDVQREDLNSLLDSVTDPAARKEAKDALDKAAETAAKCVDDESCNLANAAQILAVAKTRLALAKAASSGVEGVRVRMDLDIGDGTGNKSITAKASEGEGSGRVIAVVKDGTVSYYVRNTKGDLVLADIVDLNKNAGSSTFTFKQNQPVAEFNSFMNPRISNLEKAITGGTVTSPANGNKTVDAEAIVKKALENRNGKSASDVAKEVAQEIIRQGGSVEAAAGAASDLVRDLGGTTDDQVKAAMQVNFGRSPVLVAQAGMSTALDRLGCAKKSSETEKNSCFASAVKMVEDLGGPANNIIDYNSLPNLIGFPPKQVSPAQPATQQSTACNKCNPVCNESTQKCVSRPLGGYSCVLKTSFGVPACV